MRPLALGVLVLGLGAGLAGLAGCSHSCVPEGWYGARSVAAPQRPPGAPSIELSERYAIPGGAPQGKPTRAQACLVHPPDVLGSAAARASGG